MTAALAVLTVLTVLAGFVFFTFLGIDLAAGSEVEVWVFDRAPRTLEDELRVGVRNPRPELLATLATGLFSGAADAFVILRLELLREKLLDFVCIGAR